MYRIPDGTKDIVRQERIHHLVKQSACFVEFSSSGTKKKDDCMKASIIVNVCQYSFDNNRISRTISIAIYI